MEQDRFQKGTRRIVPVYKMSRGGKSAQEDISAFWGLEKRNDKWLVVGSEFVCLFV